MHPSGMHIRGKEMANKYSKANTQNKSGRGETSRDMQQYEEQRTRLNTGARIMAILVIAAMVVTTFLAAGIFLFD